MYNYAILLIDTLSYIFLILKLQIQNSSLILMGCIVRSFYMLLHVIRSYIGNVHITVLYVLLNQYF